MDRDAQTDEEAASDEQSGVHVDTHLTAGERTDDTDEHDGGTLPFRILLVSDLAPQLAAQADWTTEDYRHRIGPKSVADLMAELGPQLSVELPNRLGETPDAWTVDLSFPTLDSFAPEAMARQVEPTARLLEIRDLVQSVAEEEMSSEAFRTKLDEIDIPLSWADDLYQVLTEECVGSSEADSSPERNDEDGTLGRVMEMVDVEQEGGETSDGVSAGAESGATEPDNQTTANGAPAPSAADRVLARLNRALERQVQALVEHPAVQALEAAWRGLDFLASRIDFGEDIELVVLPVGKEALHEAMHHQVLVPEHSDAHTEPPTSLVVVDQAFGRTHADVKQLTDFAETGQSLQAPVVTSVDPDFFGMESMRGLEQLPSLRPHLQGDEYVEWKRLRAEEEAGFLGLALPQVRLRSSRDADSSPFGGGDDAVFGSGALVVAAAVAQSVAATGWPTHFTEYPVRGAEGRDGGDDPLAADLSGSMQSELARAGFVVLGDGEQSGALRVAQAPSVREPEVYDDPTAAAEARTESSLPCRLFVARAAHRLVVLQNTLDPSASLDVLQKKAVTEMASFLEMEASVETFLEASSEETLRGEDTAEDAGQETGDDAEGPPAVCVNRVTDVDFSNQEVLAVRLRPPDHILSSNARLAMALRVPKAG